MYGQAISTKGLPVTYTLTLAAAALSALWLIVHLAVGGRQVAVPLLATANLDPLVRDVLYLCWHFTSFGIASMAGFFLWGAVASDSAFTLVGTVLAAGFAVTGIALVHLRGANHLALPQGWLFVPVAVLGGLALTW